MKFPIAPLRLPITILCQSTLPEFLQLGEKGILSTTTVQHKRDFIPETRERLPMFGVAELLIAGTESSDRKDQMKTQLLLL